MRRVVISHVGTSALYCEAIKLDLATPEQHEQRKLELDQVRRGEELETLRSSWSTKLEEGLRRVWRDVQSTDVFRQGNSPAEIASLHALRLRAKDRVVLVCSATHDGRFAGDLVGYCLATRPENQTENILFRPNDLDVEVVTLPGIEIASSAQFVDDGLPAYMNLIAGEVWDQRKSSMKLGGDDRLILNITGGYKATIPFAVLAAQLLGTHPHRRVNTEVVYVAERGSGVVTLAPLLPLDWRQLENLREGICTLIEKPGSAAARRLGAQFSPYRQPASPDQPNALAKTVYHLINDLGWL